jgi:hypothetical protein
VSRLSVLLITLARRATWCTRPACDPVARETRALHVGPVWVSLILSLGAEPLLAASRSRYSRVGSSLRDRDPGLNLIGLFLVLLGFAILGVLIWLGRRLYARFERRVVDNPRALFRELSRAHSLSRADRDLLCEIAEWHELPDPTQLFLAPDRLQSAEMRRDLDCDSAATELETRLFG